MQAKSSKGVSAIEVVVVLMLLFIVAMIIIFFTNQYKDIIKELPKLDIWTKIPEKIGG